MRIDGISGVQQSQLPQQVSLNDDQKQQVNDILSNYDPNTATQEDQEAIRSWLRDAGIKPSRELRGILEERGFAPAERPEPTENTTQGQSSQVNASTNNSPIDSFRNLMDQYRSGALDQNQLSSQVEALSKNATQNGTSIFDMKV